MSGFSQLSTAPTDSIFTIAEEAKKAGPNCIDASIGVIVDEDGKLFAFESVKKAAEHLSIMSNDSLAYPPLLGVPTFRSSITKMIFRNTANIASIATNGGTGAVTINLMLARQMGVKNAIVPVPSWPNHKRIIEALGLKFTDVPFLEDGKATLDPLLSLIKKSEPSILVLQGSSHNPTGKTWTEQEWKTLGQALSESTHTVLLDLPYVGLAEEVGEDLLPVHILSEAKVNVLVAWSASKNHGMYGLRTGLAATVTTSEEEQRNVEAWYRILTRQMAGAASTTGQQIVALTQEHEKALWEKELRDLRAILNTRRTLLQEAFPEWNTHLMGSGLYAMLPLSESQIEELKREKIFLTAGGRVNIGGLPQKRTEEFIAKVRSISERE